MGRVGEGGEKERGEGREGKGGGRGKGLPPPQTEVLDPPLLERFIGA